MKTLIGTMDELEKNGYRMVSVREWHFECAGYSWIVDFAGDIMSVSLEDERVNGWLVSMVKHGSHWVCDGTETDGCNGAMPREVSKAVAAHISVHGCPDGDQSLYRPSDIELARARGIVRAMMLWKWVQIGMQPGPVPDLQSYELREMLDAAHTIRDYGEIRTNDGTTSHMVIPDDRLIAALYTISHWPAHELNHVETIVSGRGKGLACVVMS